MSVCVGVGVGSWLQTRQAVAAAAVAVASSGEQWRAVADGELRSMVTVTSVPVFDQLVATVSVLVWLSTAAVDSAVGGGGTGSGEQWRMVSCGSG